jgi:transposase
MKNKKLSDEQVNNLQEMLIAGQTPQDAANFFKVAVSSIHNYKKLLREQGIELPNVRGQRPKGNDSSMTPALLNQDQSLNDFLLITVQGVQVHVQNTAKSISVDANTITIKF